ncbi:hypothetical protein DICVIV_00915 [Dictyocaulus viviparus]|uniref:Uncharacterized protein n=1 Tax=Dictyocaulus viviparus TaxID=29172 RepID=A0A0D8Y824_DICVI|nr:hypothetical protein DICVIV_00915 [Dictyocaulus viviparus]
MYGKRSDSDHGTIEDDTPTDWPGKRTVMPYSGGFYGKRNVMPYSSGLYDKSSAIMPFSGGLCFSIFY